MVWKRFFWTWRWGWDRYKRSEPFLTKRRALPEMSFWQLLVQAKNKKEIAQSGSRVRLDEGPVSLPLQRNLRKKVSRNCVKTKAAQLSTFGGQRAFVTKLRTFLLLWQLTRTLITSRSDYSSKLRFTSTSPAVDAWEPHWFSPSTKGLPWSNYTQGEMRARRPESGHFLEDCWDVG